jgi:hypothetical protein
MPLPFNQVIVNTEDGPRQLTVAQFTAIPLAERVRAMLEKRVEFLLDGQPVDTREALNALRER